jgi:hypothetical protein
MRVGEAMKAVVGVIAAPREGSKCLRGLNAPPCKRTRGKEQSSPMLRLWRDARRCVSLAHLDCALGIASERRSDRQIRRPRRHLAKVADRLCRHFNLWVHLHLHFHLASYPAPVEARQRSWPCIAQGLLLFSVPPTLLTSHPGLCQVLSLFLLQLLKALFGFRDKLPKHTLEPRFLCIAENFEVRPLTSHYCLKLGDLHLQCLDLRLGNGNGRRADGWGSRWRRVRSCRCHSIASATRVAFPAP